MKMFLQWLAKCGLLTSYFSALTECCHKDGILVSDLISDGMKEQLPTTLFEVIIRYKPEWKEVMIVYTNFINNRS